MFFIYIYCPIYTFTTFFSTSISNNLVLVCSISLDLYPKDSSLLLFIQSLFDAIIHLQPFNQEMTQLLEKAYKMNQQRFNKV